MNVGLRRASVLLLAAALTAPAARAGWKEVRVDIKVPPKLATGGREKVLVAMFRGGGNEKVDVGLEVSRWIRREVARGTSLTVLDVPPPPIPEQLPEKLAVNDAFWRQLGEDFRADIIVAGIADYTVQDQSGFVDEDVQSPVTGQTVRQSRYAERRAFRLRLQVFFLKGDNGALLHTDTWTENRLVESTRADDLQELFDLLDSFKVHLQAALAPSTVREPRFIWFD